MKNFEPRFGACLIDSQQHYYWPLSSDSKRGQRTKVPPSLNLNNQQAEDARQRIRAAMQTLRDREGLPAAIKQRAEAIAREAHISSKTL
ncbi:MAG: hypothetical protein F6J95_031230 [Leptolyngbya sp. SIO1E4]|nr:hypothetical protein [Leptolyngbya sp. SIO1E4]